MDMHFMIDFENVLARGLQGCEYMNERDKITIFYSQACAQIENRWLQAILATGADLDICKLQKTGKNALDFYIASRIGEEYGEGFSGVIAIVSNDKGFQAVRGYWKYRSEARQIILKSDIEQCILAMGEKNDRNKMIQNNRRKVSLEVEFEKYKERKRIKEAVKEVLAETEYVDNLVPIIDMLQLKSTQKVLYLDTLKKYGRKDGLNIYKRIKEVV